MKIQKLVLPCCAHAVAITLVVSQFTESASGQTRVPWYQPFASSSIWNTPIGDGATYTSNVYIGNISDEWVEFDIEDVQRILPTDPLVATQYPDGSACWLGNTRVPHYFTVTNNQIGEGNGNYCVTLIQENLSLYQWQPTSRPAGMGGPLRGFPKINDGSNGSITLSSDVTSEAGTHYGSGMSSLGGSIRKGELTSPEPIRHALKLNIWGARYYYRYTPNGNVTKGPGWRWPARNADGGFDDPNNGNYYNGNNPELTVGSLLAIPRTVSESTLGLETAVGSKLFYAMRNYGVYLVDNSGWQACQISAERGVMEEIEAKYSFTVLSGLATTSSSAFGRDVGRLLRQLQVVTNNTPSTKGGPGNRLVTPAGGLGNMSNLSNGDFQFTMKGSTRVLSISGGSTANGANLTIADANGASYQNLGLVHIGAGYYKIEPRHVAGKGLDVSGISYTAGAQVCQWSYNGGNNQLYSLVPWGNGYYYIEARHSGLVLTADSANNGATVKQQRFVASDLQLFSMSAVGNIVSGAVYELEPQCALGKRLDAFGSGEGANIGLWTDNNGNNQRFVIENVGGGFYELTPQNSTTRRLNVNGGSSSDGTNVNIWTDNNGNAQRWQILDQGNGTYELAPECGPGSRLDVSGGGSADGTNVMIYHDVNSNGQRWKLYQQ